MISGETYISGICADKIKLSCHLFEKFVESKKVKPIFRVSTETVILMSKMQK